MNRSLLSAVVAMSLASSALNFAFAKEIPLSCTFDYHVLAMYKDGSGAAIERTNQQFSLNYETGHHHDFQKTIAGKSFLVTTNCMRTGSKPDGSPMGYPAVILEIRDTNTTSTTDSAFPLKAQKAGIEFYLDNQAPVLPNESSRSPIWSIDCDWQGDATSDCM